MKQHHSSDPVADRPAIPWWLMLLGLSASAAEVVAVVLLVVAQVTAP